MSRRKLKKTLRLLSKRGEDSFVAEACVQVARLLTDKRVTARADIEDQAWIQKCAVKLLGLIYAQHLLPGRRSTFEKEVGNLVLGAELGGAVNSTSLFQGAAFTLESLIEQWAMAPEFAERAREVLRKNFKELDTIFSESGNG